MIEDIQKLLKINDQASAVEYLESLKKRATEQMTCRLIYKGMDDDFIAQVTSSPIKLIKELRNTYLTVEDVIKNLGMSHKNLEKLIHRGLTIHDGKIPLYVVNMLKNDPVFIFLMQWEYQVKKQKNQTEEELLEDIKYMLAEYEEDFGFSYEEAFDRFNQNEIDESDLLEWRSMILELQRIESNRREKCEAVIRTEENSNKRKKITRLSDKSTTKATAELRVMNENILRILKERKHRI